MSISQRLRNIAIGVCSLILVLTFLLLSYQWRDYVAAGQRISSFETFRALLIVMEKVSAERGPSNGALGEDFPVSEARMSGLDTARRRSDASIGILLARLADARCRQCSAELVATRKAVTSLSSARANIDRLLLMPLAKRSPQELGNAVNRMVNVIVQLTPVADKIGLDIARGDTDILDELQTAHFAAMLREQSGLLGSRFTSALAGGRALTAQEQYDIERSYGRIDQLQALIDSRIGEDAPVQARNALQRMKEQYFGQGMEYVANIRMLASFDGQKTPTTQQFAERYVPSMRPIIDFRDDLLEEVRDELSDHRNASRTKLLATGSLAAVMVGALFLMVWLFREKVIKPFTEATGEIIAVATGNLAGDVAGRSAYSGEIKELFEAVHTLKLNSRDRKNAIDYASLIQRAILPDRQLQERFGYCQHFVLWKPRDAVGGDFYIYRENEEGSLLGVIDCAGHSVPGAMMTMLALAAIDQAIDETQTYDPAAILMRTDQIMRGMFEAEGDTLATSMDAALVRIDHRQRRLLFCGARMSLFASDGRDVREYKGGRRSIAGKRRSDSANIDIPLEAGWTFYLCTDGFFDQSGGEHGYGFGSRRFAEMLRGHAALPMEEQAQAFERILAQYQGDRPQRDDITLLSFRVE
jgi:serine phosphatase RsbU (regulator of sigma subunit)